MSSASTASSAHLEALIVSTNRRTVESLRGVLAGLGYRVRASRDVAAGVRRFRRTLPALLILDARLLAGRTPEEVLGRFHVWRRHGDHYHPHDAHEPTAPATPTPAPAGRTTLTLQPADLSVHVGEQAAILTPTEFAMLYLLLRHRGRAVTRDELLDVSQHAGVPFDRVVDRHICNIRHKIEVDPEAPPIIETVRGIGYRIEL